MALGQKGEYGTLKKVDCKSLKRAEGVATQGREAVRKREPLFKKAGVS